MHLCFLTGPSIAAASQSQSHITTDSQSASPSWCQAPIWNPRSIFFLLEIFIRKLRVCYFVAPSLTRGRVCNLLLQLDLASAVSRDSRPYFIAPILETRPTWRARSPYLYPPGTGWPSYTPGHWVPFPSPLTTRRDYGGGILTRLHTGFAAACITHGFYWTNMWRNLSDI
jgi:hypothetical protein